MKRSRASSSSAGAHSTGVRVPLLSTASKIAGRRLLGWTFFTLLLFFFLTPQLALSQGPMPGDTTELDGSVDSTYSEQILYFEEDPVTGVLSFDIEFGGETWNLALTRTTVRADGYQVLIDDGGRLRAVTPPPVRTWIGFVGEASNREIRATIREDAVYGTMVTAIIYPVENIDFSDAIVIQPASTLELSDPSLPTLPGGPAGDPAPVRDLHVIYRASDVSDGTEGICATREGATMMAALGGGMNIREGLHLCELAIDADFDFYEANDSSVADTVATIEEVINCVIPIYEIEDIAITFEITAIVVRVTGDDPYDDTDPVDLLETMIDTWTTDPEDTIPFDAVHLFTDADLYGGIVGLTNTAAVCDDDPFGLSRSMYTALPAARVALTAHELGHGFNASHCSGSNCQIMCPTITGCSGQFDSFGVDAVDNISEYRDGVDCLTELGGPVGLPFIDEFTESEFDDSNWLFVHGASIDDDAIGEPSPDYAMVLGASSENDILGHEIRSNQILLEAIGDATLSYSIENRGTEGGETLFVEYLDMFMQWQELDAHVAGDEESTEFEAQLLILPVEAYHNQFRLRFRVSADDSGDQWYVDDVEIREVPESPAAVNTIEPEVGPVAGENEITILGSGFLPGLVVSIGDQELEDLEFVSSSVLTGTIPAADEGGSVDVVINQLNGETTIYDGYTYSDNYLQNERTDAFIGDEMWLATMARHTLALGAFSFGVETDADLITVTEVTIEGTAAEDAEFVEIEIDNTIAEGYWTIAVVIDASYPFETEIAVGDDTIVAYAHYRVTTTAQAGDVALLPFTGARDVDMSFSGRAVSVTPPGDPGCIRVLGTPPMEFVRGDANRDDAVELIDAIEILMYLFQSEPLPCEDAADVSDEGRLSLLDPMLLLSYLFNNGNEPVAPFPLPDVDPTPDDLECAM